MRGLDHLPDPATISPLAWLPISLAGLPRQPAVAIFVIFITSVWPIIINTRSASATSRKDYRNVAAVLRLNHLESSGRS